MLPRMVIMDLLMKNAFVLADGGIKKRDLLISGGTVADIGDNIPSGGSAVLDFSGKYIFPGFVDVHVHFREPGFSYKETISTGISAAAHGGYTTVCTMPNTCPVPDGIEGLRPQLEAIGRDGRIRVVPFGSITKGENGKELSDMEAISELVAGFSDDGRGVQDGETMRMAMRKAGSLGRIISAHCEDESLIRGGLIHDGDYAKAHGIPGICSESEWRPIERDIALARETGAAYHVCHVSAKESVALIREAKKCGVDITCETAPHYLLLDDGMIKDDGRYRINPPIRSRSDREALIAGILDGTVDMIATDHAPHSAEEKSGGLRSSKMGVVGLETAFPVLLTKLVDPGVIGLSKLIELLSLNPAKRFSLGNGIEKGGRADICVFDLEREYEIDPNKFLSKGRSTPFAGMRVRGECIMTMAGGKTVWAI